MTTTTLAVRLARRDMVEQATNHTGSESDGCAPTKEGHGGGDGSEEGYVPSLLSLNTTPVDGSARKARQRRKTGRDPPVGSPGSCACTWKKRLAGTPRGTEKATTVGWRKACASTLRIEWQTRLPPTRQNRSHGISNSGCWRAATKGPRGTGARSASTQSNCPCRNTR